jgi:hypothetical protein
MDSNPLVLRSGIVTVGNDPGSPFKEIAKVISVVDATTTEVIVQITTGEYATLQSGEVVLATAGGSTLTLSDSSQSTISDALGNLCGVATTSNGAGMKDSLGNFAAVGFGTDVYLLGVNGEYMEFDSVGDIYLADSTGDQFSLASVSGGTVTASDAAGDSLSLSSGDAAITADSISLNAASTLGFFSATPAVQQSVSALTNNITPGGTTGTLDNWTSLTVYATDAAAIRNACYQLGLELSELRNAMHAYGLC